MAVKLIKEQVKAKKVARKRVANVKKLVKVYRREVGEVGKIAKAV